MAIGRKPSGAYEAAFPVSLPDGTTAYAVPTVLVDATGASAPSGSASDPSYAQTAPLTAGTDRSGVAGTTSAPLAPANAARRGLNIQNISAANLGINEVGGAASIGSPGTYTIAAGGSLNVRTNRAVSVVASAANSAYTATEF